MDVTYNRPSGGTVGELRERAAHALAREWGISEAEACEALDRAAARERRLGVEVARAQVWSTFPEPRGPVTTDVGVPV